VNSQYLRRRSNDVLTCSSKLILHHDRWDPTCFILFWLLQYGTVRRVAIDCKLLGSCGDQRTGSTVLDAYLNNRPSLPFPICLSYIMSWHEQFLWRFFQPRCQMPCFIPTPFLPHSPVLPSGSLPPSTMGMFDLTIGCVYLCANTEAILIAAQMSPYCFMVQYDVSISRTMALNAHADGREACIPLSTLQLSFRATQL
jgi:hypothetical protein